MPEQAWAIYEISDQRSEGWKIVKLMAERRYGELLGPALTAAEAGRKGGQAVTGSNRLDGATKAEQHRARKVAAISEEKFNDYIGTEPKNPTRAGLFRFAGVTTKPRKSSRRTPDGLWQNEDVLAWVHKRMKAGKIREEIMAESKAGTNGWPIAGKHLPQNAADRCIAIIKDRSHRPKQGKSGPTLAGKRVNQIRKEIAAARLTQSAKFWEIGWAASRLTYELTVWEIEDVDLDEGALDVIDTVHSDLLHLQVWMNRTFAKIESRYGEQKRRQVIDGLLSKTVANGCTPEEEELAQEKAGILQRKLDASLAA